MLKPFFFEWGGGGGGGWGRKKIKEWHMRKLTFSHMLSEDWDQAVLSQSEKSSRGTL